MMDTPLWDFSFTAKRIFFISLFIYHEPQKMKKAGSRCTRQMGHRESYIGETTERELSQLWLKKGR